MSELSFLLDLLLNQKLNKEVKTLITERIKLIEARPTAFQAPQRAPQVFVPPELVGQSPSTIANLMKDQQPIPLVEPAPVIATTAATAQAMAERQKTIQLAMSGKNEPGRTSPRKF